MVNGHGGLSEGQSEAGPLLDLDLGQVYHLSGMLFVRN